MSLTPLCLALMLARVAAAAPQPPAETVPGRAIRSSAQTYGAVKARVGLALDQLSMGEDPEVMRQLAKVLNPKLAARARAEARNVSAVKAAPAAPAAGGEQVEAFEYKLRGRYTDVVVTIQDHQVNGSSTDFRLTVDSTHPLQGWVLRERGSEAEIERGELTNRLKFSKRVERPYAPNYVLNLYVYRDGTVNTDFFKVYQENTVQSR